MLRRPSHTPRPAFGTQAGHANVRQHVGDTVRAQTAHHDPTRIARRGGWRMAADDNTLHPRQRTPWPPTLDHLTTHKRPRDRKDVGQGTRVEDTVGLRGLRKITKT